MARTILRRSRSRGLTLTSLNALAPPRLAPPQIRCLSADSNYQVFTYDGQGNIHGVPRTRIQALDRSRHPWWLLAVGTTLPASGGFSRVSCRGPHAFMDFNPIAAGDASPVKSVDDLQCQSCRGDLPAVASLTPGPTNPRALQPGSPSRKAGKRSKPPAALPGLSQPRFEKLNLKPGQGGPGTIPKD
jgi:hypothetical protein